MIHIEIDGKKVFVDEGASIIEAADDAGIYIPRFCYHKKLSVAANCRMCLVEVDKVGKPLPACATPVSPDMKVYTHSQMAMEAQKSVMEFLLINHPLDCPICDQGGQCELQDLSMGYGHGSSFYHEKKRAVFSEDIGPLIETEMTRCIHCTRCVRFGDEIAGMRELGVVNRGEHSEIGTYVKHMVRSELSGNVIDLCPVGALTAKPSRYTVRGWEAIEHPMIAPHDCVGSNIFVHTKGREYSHERLVMRVVPRKNESINENWISDRDRFAFEGLAHPDRCYYPMIKENEEWIERPWEEILRHVALRVNALAQECGGEQIAALVSPNATLEESYLLQTFLRTLGSNNIDYRLREHDANEQQFISGFPGQGIATAAIEQLDAILLVGSNIRFEQPMISHRINKAVSAGAQVFVINPVDYPFIFPCAGKIITRELNTALGQILKALGVSESCCSSLSSPPAAEDIAHGLKSASNAAIFMGAFAWNHPQSTEIRTLVDKVAQQAVARVGVFTEGANAAGAYLAGALPHCGVAGARVEGLRGRTAKEMLVDQPARGYFLLGLEPEHDTAFPYAALQSLDTADLVVCMTTFVSDVMKKYADVILPIAPFTENEGTFVNAEGIWQSFEPVGPCKKESKPAWKILRGLARAMEFDSLEHHSVKEIHDVVQKAADNIVSAEARTIELPQQLTMMSKGLLRLGEYPMYCVDPVVRRALALQETLPDNVACIALNEKEAQLHGFTGGDLVNATQDGASVTLPIMIDNRLADGVVSIPMGLAETMGFGTAISRVELIQGVS